MGHFFVLILGVMTMITSKNKFIRTYALTKKRKLLASILEQNQIIEIDLGCIFSYMVPVK